MFIQSTVCWTAPRGFPTVSYTHLAHKVKIAGELKGYKAEDHMDKMTARRLARFTQLSIVASRQAIEQSGLDMEKEDASRCCVNISSGIGGLGTIAVSYTHLFSTTFSTCQVTENTERTPALSVASLPSTAFR